mmetsp:Transcript_92362/g.197921  ORF Transcript_92362/g.197921 Transcript_92362/m.197921 type:complete len:394 (-) Transcript_92362:122-1303(-)
MHVTRPRQRGWQLLGPWPSDALGRFGAGVEALLEAEFFAEEAAEEAAQEQELGYLPHSRGEARRMRRRMRELGAEAEDLEEEALQVLGRLGEQAAAGAPHRSATVGSELRPVVVAWTVLAATLRELAAPGCLGPGLELQRGVADLRPGWQLLGGLSLVVAAPKVAPVPANRREVALGKLRELAGAIDVAYVAVQVPLLDAVAQQMHQLGEWRQRSALAEEESRLAERWKARAALVASTERERARLAAGCGGRSFDAADVDCNLAPAHLENRVTWDEYRNAERLVNFHKRRRAFSAVAEKHRQRRSFRLQMEELRSLASLTWEGPPPPLAHAELHAEAPAPAAAFIAAAVDRSGAVLGGLTSVRELEAAGVLASKGQAIAKAAAADIERRLRRL